MSILDEIVSYKHYEVEVRKQNTPLERLQASNYYTRSTYSLAAAIESNKGKAIIAEFKRRSPSKGIINNQADALQTVTGYAEAGAVGISVLTDEKFFGGSTADLIRVRDKITAPILRKDFIVDSYQIHEAKAIGSDVILLIAACLTPEQLHDFSLIASSIGLETLFEIHQPEEIEKLPPHARLVGVNNRNLKSFEVNLNHAMQTAKLLPSSCLKIAESGIHSVHDAILLAQAGFDAFLIGEYFMKHSSPNQACKAFLNELNMGHEA
jgi:indole-3-glycerol phosphate synthase